MQYCLTTDIDYPLSMAKISDEQNKLEDLRKILENGSDDPDWNRSSFEEIEVVTFKGKIVIPPALQNGIIEWYHEVLRHPGKDRTYQSISHQFHWKNLRKSTHNFVESCDLCNRLKRRTGSRYGHLPLKDTDDDCTPWKRVYIDSIGPWCCTDKNGIQHCLNALTVIDAATGWFEVFRVNTATAEEAARRFDHEWLARYRRPCQVICDLGGEFMGGFRELEASYGFKLRPAGRRNPQANGLIERIHLVMQNMLLTYELGDRSWTGDENILWDEYLAAIAFAIRATHNTTLGASPAE